TTAGTRSSAARASSVAGPALADNEHRKTGLEPGVPRTCPKRPVVSAAVRLIVARCEVVYTGRLTAFLPESTRLLMLKDDGSVLVHADAGGYKPLNWMTPPTVIEEDDDRIVVRKRAGKTEDRLEIRLHEV